MFIPAFHSVDAIGGFEYPGMSLDGHLGQDAQVITPKALSLLPRVVVLVEPLESDVMARTVLR